MGAKVYRIEKIYILKKQKEDKDKKAEAIKLEGNESCPSPLKFFCMHQTRKRHTYMLL